MNPIIAIVARYYHEDPARLTLRRGWDAGGNRRLSRICQVAMHVLREQGYSVIEIGGILGRDHSTVVLGLRALRRRMDADAELREQVGAVSELARPGVSLSVHQKTAGGVA